MNTEALTGLRTELKVKRQQIDDVLLSLDNIYGLDGPAPVAVPATSEALDKHFGAAFGGSRERAEVGKRPKRQPDGLHPRVLQAIEKHGHKLPEEFTSAEFEGSNSALYGWAKRGLIEKLGYGRWRKTGKFPKGPRAAAETRPGPTPVAPRREITPAVTEGGALVDGNGNPVHGGSVENVKRGWKLGAEFDSQDLLAAFPTPAAGYAALAMFKRNGWAETRAPGQYAKTAKFPPVIGTKPKTVIGVGLREPGVISVPRDGEI